MDINDMVFVPFPVAQKQMLGIDYVNAIVIQATSAETVHLALEDAKTILRRHHNIRDPSDDDFTVLSPEFLASSFGLIASALTLFLSLIAAVSLIVGGIGIMNVMLVSVAERMREIGLRRAIGATQKDILWQFLFESVVLTVLGGIIGIILGLILSFIGGLLISKILQVEWLFFLPFSAMIIAFFISVLIGLVFGLYPARKAADLNPIEALRYE
jgi:putative ABC transport system permease protein